MTFSFMVGLVTHFEVFMHDRIIVEDTGEPCVMIIL